MRLEIAMKFTEKQLAKTYLSPLLALSPHMCSLHPMRKIGATTASKVDTGCGGCANSWMDKSICRGKGHALAVVYKQTENANQSISNYFATFVREDTSALHYTPKQVPQH